MQNAKFKQYLVRDNGVNAATTFTRMLQTASCLHFEF
jgi:hypothetical protein